MSKRAQRLKAIPKGAMLLGEGVLSWPKHERVSDRYGTVTLFTSPLESYSQVHIDVSGMPGTRQGRLIAEVVKSRLSSHIGDFCRALFPRQPKDGEIIVLGEGELFSQDSGVGLSPSDGRENDWLNPRALYDVHESVVKLYFAKEK